MTDAQRIAVYTALKPKLPATVIWANPNAPRPAKPYATLEVISSVDVGMEHTSKVDAQGIQKLYGQREDIVRVQVFGSGAFDSLCDMRNALATTAMRYPMLRAGLAPVSVDAVTDVARLMNGVEIEPRASVDVTIRYQSDVSDTVGLIETVDTTGSMLIDNAGNTVSVDLIINKP